MGKATEHSHRATLYQTLLHYRLARTLVCDPQNVLVRDPQIGLVLVIARLACGLTHNSQL